MSKKKKPSVLKKASALRAQYRTWLFRMIVCLVVCLVILGIYCVLNMNGAFESVGNLGLLPWLAALVAAAVVGYFGNRFSKAHREYETFLDIHDLTNFDVVEFEKNSQ